MNPLLRQRKSRVPVKRIWLKQMGKTDQLHQLPGALSRSIKLFQVNLGWSSPSDSDLFFSFISCDLIPAGWNPEQDQPVTTEISIHIYFVGWNFFHSPKFPFNIYTYILSKTCNSNALSLFHLDFSHLLGGWCIFTTKIHRQFMETFPSLIFISIFFSFVAFSIRIRTF